MALVWHEAEMAFILHSTSGPVGRHLATVCAQVETASKAVCPVLTGRLRSSITWRLETDSGDLCGIVGTNVSYAIYVHQGTWKMPGRPFLLWGVQAVFGHA